LIEDHYHAPVAQVQVHLEQVPQFDLVIAPEQLQVLLELLVGILVHEL
jgi:hypothetical protein